MKILVVGLGSIGRRHLRNLKQIAPETEIGVWRQQSRDSDLGDLAPAVSKVFFEEHDALAWGARAALVTNPAPLHVPTGLRLADSGAHLFVEKPLSDNAQGVTDLIDLCRRRQQALMVGYHLRFFPPLQRIHEALAEGLIGQPLFLRAEVGQYLPDWRKGKDYRFGVSASCILGGGAVLELSHELDYACWLMGKAQSISAAVTRVSQLEIDVEDLAEVTLAFEGGGVGSLHMDMIQRVPVRSCKVVGSDGTLVADLLQSHVRLWSSADGSWTDLYQDNTYDKNAMYLAEMRHFLRCVEGLDSPVVSGEDGYRTLTMVLAAKEAATQRRTVAI